MSGVGKSTIGKKLASDIGYEFIDVDKIMESREGVVLQEILDKMGDEGFIKLEEQAILNLSSIQNSIISPGGSVIYSDKAIEHLKSISTFVYLKISLEELEKRLPISKRIRGIVGLKHKTLAELYNERTPFYEKYADIIIDVVDKNPDIVIREIKNKIGI